MWKVKSVRRLSGSRTRFDIEVRDCHNFFANGVLVHNSVGQDVTDNVRSVASIPNSIGVKGRVTVFGEVYMKHSVFLELTGSGAVVLKNPRNAAAGAIAHKTASKTADMKLDLFGYSVTAEGERFETEAAMREWSSEMIPEIEYVPVEVLDLADADEVQSVVDAWEEKRSELDYCIDGLVFAVDSIEVQEDAGWTGKRPNGKLAYKFKPEQAKTVLEGIDWQVGRTGKITPVARLQPVSLDGSTVGKSTLHNFARVRELGLGIGDTVLIEKGGDIIPQVLRVVESAGSKDINYPERCPCCGAETLNDQVTVWCDSSKCDAQMERRFLHYLRMLDVKGIGPANIADFRRAGLLTDLADLHKLNLVKIATLEGYGKRSAEMVGDAMDEKDEIPLWTFLAALGIQGLARTTSKLIAKQFKTLATVRTLTPPVLQTLQGIGTSVSASVCKGLDDLSETIDALLEVVTVLDVVESTGPLAGKSFCLTGAMSRPRKELQKMIEDAGGETKSSVGAGLSFLVQADPSSTSGKTKKAQKHGVGVISEEELMEMME